MPEVYSRPVAGGKVQAWRITPSAPPRGLVLFAHATGNDALFPQLELFKILLAHGYAIFSFDLDGHGRLSTTQLHATHVLSAVKDAVAAANMPHLPLHAIGQSLGASLLLAAAAAGELPARSLTAISAPTQLNLKALALLSEVRALGSKALLRQLAHYGPSELVPAFGQFKRQTYPVRIEPDAGTREAGSFAYVNIVNAIIAQLQLPSRCAGVAVPTLLIYGANDHITRLTQGEQLASCIPHSRLFVAPSGTHFTTPFAAAVPRAICAFLLNGDQR